MSGGCGKHDCFDEAAAVYDALTKNSDRVGFFLFVHDNVTDQGDNHWLGNTAMAGRAFETLVETVVAGHEKGKCSTCDRIAQGLAAALIAYRAFASGAGSC